MVSLRGTVRCVDISTGTTTDIDDPMVALIQKRIDELARQGDAFRVRATDRDKEAMRRAKQYERQRNKELH